MTDFESTGRSSPSPSPSPSFETPVAEAIVDWRSMDGGEIYDRLIQKGAKLGIQANKVIRGLKKKGYFAEQGCTLAKNKGTLFLSFLCLSLPLTELFKLIELRSDSSSRA